MCEFSSKRIASRSSSLACSLVRVATWVVPLLALIQQDLTAGLSIALLLGFADGSARARFSRSVRSMVATREGLVISAGLSVSRVPWANVLGVQTWRAPGDVDHVAVHYRGPRGGAIARCWEQFAHDDLLAFIAACAAHVSHPRPRSTITLLGPRERSVWSPIVQRIAEDLSIAACLALLLRPVLLLGITATLTSALIACLNGPLHPLRYVLKEGRWWRETKRGPRPITVIPAPLRLWVDSLSRNSPTT